jgi:hypothetical protein
MAKITRPETDLEILMSLVQQGASFRGNIESTSESGPALIAAHAGELVIVACNDLFQPVIAVLENGTMQGSVGAKAYWRVSHAARTLLGEGSAPIDYVQKGLWLDRDKWN